MFPLQLNFIWVMDFYRIEILCHDINVHVPHHISPRIPSYNLRAAYDSIKQNWGKVIRNSPTLVHFSGSLHTTVTSFIVLQYVNEANWNWRLMKTILTRCHVYDKERYYVPFDELVPEESQPIKFLRKFMPDYAWCCHSCWLVESTVGTSGQSVSVA